MTIIQQLITNRLILRAPEERDLVSYQRNFCDYEVIRHLDSVVPWPYPENGVKEFFQNEIKPRQGKNYWSWGIFLKSCPDEMIGGIGLWRPGGPSNRGFWLAKDHWGKGIMTESSEAVTKYAFEELRFEKLIFDNALGNTRSARIKEKQGCTKVGVRKAKFVDPAYSEMESWELTKDAWLQHQTSKDTNK